MIRPEDPQDVAAVHAVVQAAFGSPAEGRLVEAIRGSANYIPALSLVAELNGVVVGHVMISYAMLECDGKERPIANLSPLAVHPDFHRRGIGSALVRAALARADELGEPAVVLEGDPRFYGRFGFEHSELHGISIHLPSWAPPEAAQMARLSRYDPSLRGEVVYPPAFDEVSEGVRES